MQQAPESFTPTRTRRWYPSSATVTFVTMMALAGYSLLQTDIPTAQDQLTDRNQLADCWHASGPDAGPASGQRARLAECDALESGFRRKYGGPP